MQFVGEEKTPIFSLDDYMIDVQDSIKHACQFGNFTQADTYYPGVRCELPNDYVFTVLTSLTGLIRKIYDIPAQLNPSIRAGYYSLVNTSPAKLDIKQRIPHYDGFEPYRYALLHFLNPEPHGGTAFYRHKSTGFENIYQGNEKEYWAAFDAFTLQFGEPNRDYIVKSDTQYERIAQLSYKQNRLALYPSTLLHSGIIEPKTDISSDPHTGRLTANIFLNFQ
jgi:hypothetical protein